MSQLTRLREVSTVVADTGDIDAIAQHQPVDATTNPSLLLAAAKLPQYRDLVDQAAARVKRENATNSLEALMDHLAVTFGTEILKLIPGRVSTEVDARLSFNTNATIARARRLIGLYDAAGITADRVLIKIASTWEGIEAAAKLEKEGIHCNLTLLFSFTQAVACADAGVSLISPFVGRIFDWYCKALNVTSFKPDEDPGVKSVSRIYNYYKYHDYRTEIMGASFRNTDQILALAGCDLLTISPSLLEALDARSDDVPIGLSIENAKTTAPVRWVLDEAEFRWHLNEDEMATDKLAEGIRRFAADTVQLQSFLSERLA